MGGGCRLLDGVGCGIWDLWLESKSSDPSEMLDIQHPKASNACPHSRRAAAHIERSQGPSGLGWAMGLLMGIDVLLAF